MNLNITSSRKFYNLNSNTTTNNVDYNKQMKYK